MIRLAVILCLFASSVTAQQQCGPTELIGKQLRERYGEEVHAMGIMTHGTSIVKLWVNEKTGSFTITRDLPNGMSCLRNAGTDFEWVEPKIKGDDL